MKSFATNRTNPGTGTRNADLTCMTPTDIIRAYRESILSGDTQHPFDDGVTARQCGDFVKKLREAAVGASIQ